LTHESVFHGLTFQKFGHFVRLEKTLKYLKSIQSDFGEEKHNQMIIENTINVLSQHYQKLLDNPNLFELSLKDDN
jgi:hypothetical protein